MQAAYKNQLAYFALYFYEPSSRIELEFMDYETIVITIILRGHIMITVVGLSKYLYLPYSQEPNLVALIVYMQLSFVAVTGVEPISGGSKPPILILCTIPLWTTCGIRTPPSQCKCEVLPSYTTRPIFGGRGETRTHLPRRPIRRFVDAGWFYRPVPLLSHNLWLRRGFEPPFRQ